MYARIHGIKPKAYRGKTQNEVAKALGITPKTFFLKLKKRVFGADEIEVMIDYLSIGDPLSIFCAKNET